MRLEENVPRKGYGLKTLSVRAQLRLLSYVKSTASS